MSSFSSTAPIPRTANDLLASYTNFERQYQTHRISLRVLIPRSYSGKIIGPQGRTIQNIINFYHVFLQFSKCESSREFKRLFTIRGRAEDCAMACTNCFEMLLLAYNDPILKGVDFILPDLFIEHLKENNVFREMAEQTNTEIRVMSKFLPESTERIVRISIPAGSKDIQSFYRAVKILAQQLEENLTLYMCAPDNKFYQQEEESEVVFMDDDAYASDQAEEVYCELTTEAQHYLQLE
ncbi:Insulin-like growth factor 2 mRNA-binding protein 3 [Mucor circinelloides]